MDSISFPKNLEGWGLIDLRAFRKVLLCKSLWRGIFGDGPWSVMVKQKYMKGKSLEYWFRTGAIGTKQGFSIWLNLRKVKKYFLKNLKWRIFSGNNILIGLDPIACCWGCISIPNNLIFSFHRIGYFTWDKLISNRSGLTPLWKDASNIGLPIELSSSWNNVKDALVASGIHRGGPNDHLAWSLSNAHMTTQLKDIYSDIISSNVSPTSSKFPTVLWKSGCPLKMILFSWLVFNNKNLTWDNLRKRSWHGPSRCSMCEVDEESNLHMFFQCNSSQQIWYDLAIYFGFPHVVFVSIHAAFEWWCKQREVRHFLIVIMLWCAWKWRNHKIFKDSKIPYKSILHNIMVIFDSLPKKMPK